MSGAWQTRAPAALLPDRLKAAWGDVEAKLITAAEFEQRRIQWLREYGGIWREALRSGREQDLTESLITEIALLTGQEPAVVEQRCRRAVTQIADEWNREVDAGDRHSVENYYDQSEGYIYDLTWWHTLTDDDSPLGYVTALDFARRNGCRSYLDFGSGVGAGAVLFGRHGFDVALADISSVLLGFCRRRLDRRRMPARFIDLKHEALPDQSFDMITAMDVFEHLVDPVQAVTDLHRALKPGGYLFGRFHAEVDPDHPQHIVLDFAPAFDRLRELGFTEVWRDEWLWGHQIFQRSGEV